MISETTFTFLPHAGYNSNRRY